MDADFLRNVEFREQLRGYDPRDVDDVIDSLIARLEAGGAIHRVDLDGISFGTARFRGYHRGDVDALLETLRDAAR